MATVAKRFTVQVTETGECLAHESLDYILDVITQHHGVAVEDLLESVCITEIQTLDGYSGGTLPLRKQVELIEGYMRRKGS